MFACVYKALQINSSKKKRTWFGPISKYEFVIEKNGGSVKFSKGYFAELFIQFTNSRFIYGMV